MGVAALKRGHFVSPDCHCLLRHITTACHLLELAAAAMCLLTGDRSVGVVVGVAGAVLTVSSLGPGLASTELLLPDSLSPSRATALQY